MEKTKAGYKLIGNGRPCFIIAEAGVNHNGDISIAKQLTDAAKNAGADAIKFQTFIAENLVTSKGKKASYQHRSNEKTQYAMLKKLELNFDDFHTLKKYCDKKNIEFISTPYDTQSVNFLDNLGVFRFKISSADIVNKPLIESVAKTKKQIILSTGMASLGEIERTLKVINDLGNFDIVLLHCTTSYPTPYNQVNLKVMDTLKNAFDLPIGYSDHTLGIEIPIMAASYGAKVIEKHLTIDSSMEGPDHFASLETHHFKEMVTSIRRVEEAFGEKRKQITKDEKKNILYMRRSIHASQNVKKDSRITQDNVKIVRPFDGIEPWSLENILGKKVKVNLKKDDPIKWRYLL